MENSLPKRPAMSGGARPAMAPRRLLLLLRSRVGKKREREGDRIEGGLGERGGVPTRRRGRSGRGPTSLVYGCHVVAVGGGEAGASVRREEDGDWAARASGPKGRRPTQQRLPPFLILL